MITNATPSQDDPACARLAELKAGLDRDDHPLESAVTIRRIEAAEASERDLAILWAGVGER
jgi:hypothetical protein